MANPQDSSLQFFSRATPDQWKYVLSKYGDVLKLRATERSLKKPEELMKLDEWYQGQLNKTIQSRKEPHVTHEELVKITKWKLYRGKTRTRILDLVKINTEHCVVTVTKKAFKKAPTNLSSAITALTTLKGIGPATASAILAAGYPQYCPYMADESMLATPGVEATDYTLAEFNNYAEQIKKVTDKLTEQDPKGDWTPHKVELTLWTHYVAKELNPDILTRMPFGDGSPRIHEGSNDGVTPDENAAPMVVVSTNGTTGHIHAGDEDSMGDELIPCSDGNKVLLEGSEESGESAPLPLIVSDGSNGLGVPEEDSSLSALGYPDENNKSEIEASEESSNDIPIIATNGSSGLIHPVTVPDEDANLSAPVST